MWMMGYNDGGEFNSNIEDSFNGRKLRPLMPRQVTNHFLTLNHHLAMAEQNKRESSTQQVVSSSRWNPTPEQLQTLEELYRSGTRTPSADQIQRITAQLRRYGKIEGKNVFYWFQNHKARERQKRRRHLQSSSDQPPPHNAQAQEKYEENANELPAGTGVNRTVFEAEETKKWPSPTNSSTIAEKNVSTKGAAKAAADAECKADGWLQFQDEPELLQQRRNATWQMMHLSCSSSSSSPTNLIYPSSVPPVTTTVQSPVGLTILEPNLRIKTPDFIDINFVGPTYNINVQNLDNSAVEGGGGGCGGEALTLQLFPLGRKDECEDEKEEEEESGAFIMNGTSDVTPNYQFYEFLPLKN